MLGQLADGITQIGNLSHFHGAGYAGQALHTGLPCNESTAVRAGGFTSGLTRLVISTIRVLNPFDNGVLLAAAHAGPFLTRPVRSVIWFVVAAGIDTSSTQFWRTRLDQVSRSPALPSVLHHHKPDYTRNEKSPLMRFAGRYLWRRQSALASTQHSDYDRPAKNITGFGYNVLDLRRLPHRQLQFTSCFSSTQAT